MMTLLHGDYPEHSRQVLNELHERAKDKEIRVLDGRQVDETSLTQALKSSSLFGGDTVIIIENLFGKLGKKTTLIKKLSDILADQASQSDVILWEEKEVSPTVIKSLGPKAKIQLFKLPVLIFQFLDAFRPRNGKNLLTLYKQLAATEAPELIFVMMARRIRLLIQLADGAIPMGLQSWQISRLTLQAKSFTMEKLLTLYSMMLEKEVSIKTGVTPFSFSQHVEQVLITLG